MERSATEWLEVLRQSSSLLETFQHSLALQEPTVRRLARHGWTLPMWMTPAEAEHVVRTVRARRFDAWFVAAYSGSGSSARAALNWDLLHRERLRPWRATVRDILRAYDLALYRVVVPSALAVLDGVLAETAGRLHTKTDPKQLAAQQRRSATTELQILAWVSIDEFVRTVWGSHNFGSKPPARLNRNWVHHGRLQPKGSKADALRLLHALETVAAARAPTSQPRNPAA